MTSIGTWGVHHPSPIWNSHVLGGNSNHQTVLHVCAQIIFTFSSPFGLYIHRKNTPDKTDYISSFLQTRSIHGIEKRRWRYQSAESKSLLPLTGSSIYPPLNLCLVSDNWIALYIQIKGCPLEQFSVKIWHRLYSGLRKWRRWNNEIYVMPMLWHL